MFNSKLNTQTQAGKVFREHREDMLKLIDIDGTLKDVNDNEKGFEIIMNKYGQKIDDIIQTLCNKHCT